MFKIDKILLYHFPICPFSRCIRFFFIELDLEFDLKVENFWEKRQEFLELNPTGKLPFCIVRYFNYEIDFIKKKHNLISIFGMMPILDFVLEKFKLEFFDKSNDIINIERNKTIWLIINQFSKDCIEPILDLKVYNIYRKSTILDSSYLDRIRKVLKHYLTYFDKVLSTNGTLIKTENKDICDFVLGCFISSADYLGEIHWDSFQNLKDWYYGIKSRNSFKTILNDKIEDVKPSNIYHLLDF